MASLVMAVDMQFFFFLKLPDANIDPANLFCLSLLETGR